MFAYVTRNVKMVIPNLEPNNVNGNSTCPIASTAINVGLPIARLGCQRVSNEGCTISPVAISMGTMIISYHFRWMLIHTLMSDKPTSNVIGYVTMYIICMYVCMYICVLSHKISMILG